MSRPDDLGSLEGVEFKELELIEERFSRAWETSPASVRRPPPSLYRWTEAAHDFCAFSHDLPEGQRSRRDVQQLADCRLSASID